MKIRHLLLTSIFFIAFMLPSFAQQKIVETGYFKNNPALGGDVTISRMTKETVGENSFTTFEVEALSPGLYNLNTWLLPSQLADGTISSYHVRVNNEQLKMMVTPQTGDIQSYMLGEKVVLKKGKNTISFVAKVPEIAEIEFIRLSPSVDKAFISSEKFDNYMAEVKAENNRNSKTRNEGITPPVIPGWPEFPTIPDTLTYHIEDVMTYGRERLYEYNYAKLPVRYTYYRTISLTAGQTFFINSKGVGGFGHFLELFSSDETELYSWSAKSNSSGIALLNITVPYTGNYYVKVRSDKNGRLGYVNININNQYLYNNVPAFSVGRCVSSMDTEREYNVFTCNSTSDPMIWCERGIQSSENQILAYNDDWGGPSDFSWGRNSRVKKLFSKKVYGVLVSAYGSSNPVGECELYAGCWNSPIYPFFENLKAEDAIMSAVASTYYNGIDWAAGMWTCKEWPSHPFSQYYGENTLDAYDAFLGGYRYPGCTLYTRSGATEENSVIDLWAKVNGANREYTHTSIRGNSDKHHHGYDWESKIGSMERTFHPRYALKGAFFGEVVEHYRPIAVANPITLSEAISNGTAVFENVKFTDMEKNIIQARINNIGITVKNNFETKYTAWKATWVAVYSDPRKYENSQFTDLLNYCKANRDLVYMVYDKLGKGDENSMLLVDKITLVNNVTNNQMLNNIRIANNDNPTTSSGAKIVRSPYSNCMLYVKKLLTGGIFGAPSSISMDGNGDASGIAYSNTDKVTVRVAGSEIHIGFSLPEEARVNVAVLSLDGTELFSVTKGMFTAGEYNYDTRIDNSGIYLVNVEINGNVNVKKVMIK